MTALAICVKCGNRKSSFRQKCGVCSFKPSREEDLIRFFRISRPYFSEFEPDFSEEKIDEALKGFSTLIKSEKELNWNIKEIENIRKKVKDLENEGFKPVLKILLIFFGPAFLVALIILILTFISGR